MKHLRILVVGAGIGGLEAALALSKDGHDITIVEAATSFEEVGAGIRVPPNSSRLCKSWGVDLSSLKKVTSLGNRFVDWKGNKLLDVSLVDVEGRYGAPYYFLHRADLVRSLVAAAQQDPCIAIRTSCRVASYNIDVPSVQLETGELLTADLIVAADGIKSAARSVVNGGTVEPQDTGDVAYRILVPAQPLLDDPQMAHLVREPWATHWMGPEGHAVGYPLRDGQLYNIIIDVTHSSDLGEPLRVEGQVWKSARRNDELIERFKEWCPEVRKLCAMTGQYLKWKLADFDELDRWSHPNGKLVLVGDACHPMMPYMAQGAAQASEDAATLAASIRLHENLKAALKHYEDVRKPRTTYIARNTRILQDWLHIYDGPEREARDRMIREDNESNPIFWGCSTRNDWLFECNADDLTECTVSKIPQLPPKPAGQASVYRKERRKV